MAAVVVAVIEVAAETSARSAVPQVAQKRASDRFGAPQLGQLAVRGVPQLSQNLLPERFSVPQAAQIKGDPP